MSDYLQRLNAAWADAQAERAADAPTCISTFAGRGGSSTGYHMAGFRELLAVEWDAHAADTLRLNWPHLDVYHGDIAALSVDEALRRTGLAPGELDLLDGSPPCFPAGSVVITTGGAVPIETLSAGDYVLTHTGRYQKVEEVMSRPYAGELLSIRTKYGRLPVSCTPEHPFWIRRRDRSQRQPRRFSEPEWVPARDIRPGDLLCEPIASARAEFGLPVVDFKRCINVEGQSGSIRREIRIDSRAIEIDWQSPDVAWLLGLYLAEGHTRGVTPTPERTGPCRREVVFSIANHEQQEVVRRVHLAGLRATCSQHRPSVTRVTVSNVDFWALCDLFGHGAAEKSLPEMVYGMPHEWKQSLLEGYFAGDGSVIVGKRIKSVKHKATTVSRRLAEGMARLIASTLGIVGPIENGAKAGTAIIEGRKVNTRQAYVVGWAATGSHKPRPAFVEDGCAWIPVQSVEAAGPTDMVYNLEVETDHSYTVGGFAVHNCQGFSTAGRRQLDDPRNQLFREYVRLLGGLRPRAFVMENVAGMARGKMRGVYLEALDALRQAGGGYRTVSGVLNAGYFGVPQLRERLIVIGVRADLGVQPTLPAPTHKPVTVRSALRGLPSTPEGFQCAPHMLPVWARTRPGRSFKDLHPKGHMFSYHKVSPDLPAPTIVKTVGVQKSGQANNGLYHWRYPRLLTIPEIKRLGSFPDEYQFADAGSEVKTFELAWAGVGNSVPPLMTLAIARHIRQTILGR